MYGMPRRLILRDNGTYSSDWCMCSWILRRIVSNRVFELPRGIFSSNCRLIQLFVMHCRVVLRHHGSYCSDRRLCCWLIRSRLINRLFKLPSWSILVFCIFIGLFELLSW